MSSTRKGPENAARLVREQRVRQRRRQRTLLTSLVAVAVLLIAGGVGWVVWESQRSGSRSAPAGANADGTGIVVGSGPVTVDVYEDFICPACGRFEQQTGTTLDQLAEQGKARVVYHPVAYLDRASTTRYSTRASAASGCAAQGGKFREYARALFARQPAEGGPGLSEGELITVGGPGGLSERGDFGSCVRDGTYRKWTDHVTEAASRTGVVGTPTVLVDSEQVKQLSPEGITAAVQAATR
ncbi:MAG TPA: thioredoxin domain-containing protein [Micromonospora sp.]